MPAAFPVKNPLESEVWLLLPVTLIVPLVFLRHHENIARLLAGTESRIGQKAGDSAVTGHNGGPSL